MSNEIVAAVAGLTAKVEAMASSNASDHERVRSSIVELTKKVDKASATAVENGMLMSHTVKTTDDHEKRIRATERWSRTLAGGLTAIGILAGYGFQWLKSNTGGGS